MATELGMEEEAESRPSLFSLIEAGEWEQLDQSLQEDEVLAKELASFSAEGRTPLELAATLGKGDVARVLVSRGGAQVNAANKSGEHMQLKCLYSNFLTVQNLLFL